MSAPNDSAFSQLYFSLSDTEAQRETSQPSLPSFLASPLHDRRKITAGKRANPPVGSAS
jgi:hypothetical protein